MRVGLCKSFNKVIADLWYYALNQKRVPAKNISWRIRHKQCTDKCEFLSSYPYFKYDGNLQKLHLRNLLKLNYSSLFQTKGRHRFFQNQAEEDNNFAKKKINSKCPPIENLIYHKSACMINLWYPKTSPYSYLDTIGCIFFLFALVKVIINQVSRSTF